MSGEVRTGYGNTDAAALGAAVMALAAPNFYDTGPWTAMGTVVALTLILLILGYVWGHQRNLLQVLAVAGTLALAGAQVVGFLVELVQAKSVAALVHCGNTVACPGPEGEGDKSNMTQVEALIAWAGLFALAVSVNRRRPPAGA